IFENRQRGQLAESTEELAQNKLPRGLEAAVQKDGAQQRLESIRQRPEPVATAVLVLAPAQDQVRTQAKLARVLGQRPPIHQFRPRLGERPFTIIRVFFVQFAGENQLQNRITEEFEPLIGLDAQALLV